MGIITVIWAHVGRNYVSVPRWDNPSTIAKSFKSKVDITEDAFAELELVAWPNPIEEYSILKLKSINIQDKITIQIFDVNGRLVEYKTGEPNKEYRIGDSFQSGLYIINVLQANTLKQVKLIKY